MKFRDMYISVLRNKIALIFILSSIAFLISLDMFSEVTQEWVARYNGPRNDADEANAIAVDNSGNVYVTGYIDGSEDDEGYDDYGTIKYNSAGVKQWVARYNGPGNDVDVAYAIALDSSGNVYVTGLSYSSVTGYDYATIKYNSAGIKQWVARYNGSGNGWDRAEAIAVDSSGNIYVTGMSTGSGTKSDYATIKYNSAGVEQWVTRYNGSGNGRDEAYAIAVDSSGNVYVTGMSFGSGTKSDYATIKYNGAGVQQWLARYNGPGNSYDEANAIALDSSGNVYVTGRSDGSGTWFDYATIKYNSAGIQQWLARYNGPGNDEDSANAIALDSLGNIYVTGYSFGAGTWEDYVTIKYNSAGVRQWLARYNGPENDWDEAYAIAVDNSGNVYVTGESYGSKTDYDYVTIRYNSLGVNQWVERYNGPGNSDDEAFAITVDSSANVYVTGRSFGSGTSRDYATIKYSQQLPIITVTSPNGGESWDRGTIHNITWVSNGDVGSNVKITLWKGSSLYTTITSGTVNDGTHPWSIPTSLPTGSDYRVRITSLNYSTIYDFSDNYFTVTAPIFTITSPNGGENWNKGTTKTITWTSSGGVGANVRITLWKGSSLYKTIINSTENDGSYSWSIPTSLSIGSDYRIRITSTTNGSIYDLSNAYFSLN